MSNPTVELKDVDVLEYVERPWTNKKGEQSLFKEILCRYQGKVLKFPVAKELGPLNDRIGKSITLVLGLETWGDSLSPSLRVQFADLSTAKK